MKNPHTWVEKLFDFGMLVGGGLSPFLVGGGLSLFLVASQAWGGCPFVCSAQECSRYEITARAEADGTIEGRETIEWINTSAGEVSELWMHLYLEAFRDEDTVYRTEGSSDGVSYDGWGGIDIESILIDGNVVTPEFDGATMRIPLEQVLVPGAGIRIEIDFVSHLPPLAERTGCIEGFCMAGQWFPKVMRTNDDGTWPVEWYHHNSEYNSRRDIYSVELTVPESWNAIGNGHTEILPGPTYRFGGVLKDVAFAYGDDLRITRGKDLGGRVSLVVAHPESKADQAVETIELEQKALALMDGLYGPYQYDTLVTVIVPRGAAGAGGMEYPGLITTWGTDPGWSPARIRDPVIYHEIMHQIFFDMVDSDESREPWIDEGLTSYTGLRLQAQLEKTREPQFGRFQSIVYSGFDMQRMALTWRGHWPSARQEAWDFADGSDYHAGVYARPSVVLETARRVWGDSHIEKALGQLTRDHRGCRVTTEDVDGIFEQVYGTWWMESYFVPAMESSVPFNLAVVSIDGGVTIEKSGDVVVPVDVAVVLEGGEKRVLTWDGQGDETLLEIDGGGIVVEAVVDPHNIILLDADRLDNGISRKLVPSPDRPVTLAGLATVALELLFAVLMP